jgi:hypothetical protein
MSIDLIIGLLAVLHVIHPWGDPDFELVLYFDCYMVHAY